MSQLLLRVFGSVTIYAVARINDLISQSLQINRGLCLFEFFLGQVLEKILLILLGCLLIIRKLTLLAQIFLDPHFYQLLLLLVFKLHHVFEEFLRWPNRLTILLELHALRSFCILLIMVLEQLVLILWAESAVFHLFVLKLNLPLLLNDLILLLFELTLKI